MNTIEVTRAPTAGAPVVPRNALLPRLIFFGIVFVAAALQLSIGPLLPDYVHRFGLSTLGAGAIVGAVGVTILGVALPAGHLADRFGTRRLTIVAGSLLAIGALVQAAAPSFVLLIAARLVFGLGYGVLWTAGLAWLAGFGRSRSGIGVAVACSGVGGVAGPALVGFLASELGVGAPVAICGGVLVLLTLGFVAAPSGLRAPLRSDQSVAAQLRFAFRDSRFIAALVTVVVAGISTTIATLIVPIDLHAHGFSASAIGIAFSFAGVLYVIVTVLTSMKQPGRFAVSTAFAACFVIIVTLMPAALSATTGAVLAMLLASTAIRAVLWTSAYPLGLAERGATAPRCRGCHRNVEPRLGGNDGRGATRRGVHGCPLRLTCHRCCRASRNLCVPRGRTGVLEFCQGPPCHPRRLGFNQRSFRRRHRAVILRSCAHRVAGADADREHRSALLSRRREADASMPLN